DGPVGTVYYPHGPGVRRILFCALEQAVVRHTSVFGIGHGRSDGHGAGYGFHSRHLQRYARAAYCVFIYHVRGSRFALVVLSPRRSNRQTALLAYGRGSHIDLRWSKDAGRTFRGDSNITFARPRLWDSPRRG